MEMPEHPPKLSIVVVFFNMRREAARTLYTLSAQYQRGVDTSDYQVIVIDNDSSLPLGAEFVEKFGSNFEYYHLRTDSPSPAKAINYGVTRAKNSFIGCIVDGARMLTPGILFHSLLACKFYERPFVCALAWHLGSKEQNYSMLEGYDQQEEDRLLDRVDWRSEGYRLFEVASLASSSSVGFLGGIPHECSYFVMSKRSFVELCGFDERFQSPGGGLVNHDFLGKVIESGSFEFVTLLGEGSFHQFHGGIATNSVPDFHPWKLFVDEYQRIHKMPYTEPKQPPENRIHYLGHMPKPALWFTHLSQK